MFPVLRTIRIAWQSIWRNLWLSIATIAMITLTAFSLSVGIALHVGVSQLIASAEDRIDLSINFYQNATSVQVESTIQAIRKIDGVKEVIEIAPATALAEFSSSTLTDGDTIKTLQVLGENPFGYSARIVAKDSAAYGRIAAELATKKYETLIESQSDYLQENRLFIESFTNFTKNIRLVLFVVNLVFAVVASLMLFNAIRIAIYTHRNEVLVMRLVGATSAAIRTPFLLEVLFYVTLSVFIAASLFFSLLSFVQPYLATFFINEVDLKGYFLSNGVYVFVGELALLSILAIVSCTLALRRYLRV